MQFACAKNTHLRAVKLKRAKLLAARYPVESIFLAILLSHRLMKKRHRKFVFWNLFFISPASQPPKLL